EVGAVQHAVVVVVGEDVAREGAKRLTVVVADQTTAGRGGDRDGGGGRGGAVAVAGGLGLDDRVAARRNIGEGVRAVGGCGRDGNGGAEVVFQGDQDSAQRRLPSGVAGTVAIHEDGAG